MPIAPVISLPHNFEADDRPETLRLKLGEFSRSVEDLFNRQVSIYVMYSRKQKLPTLKKGDIIMDFSAHRGFATLQQWDGKKLVPLALAASSIIGLIDIITQGKGSGTDPTVFLRSDGADGWVLDHVDLLFSRDGSGSDPTKYLRYEGLGGWVLDTPAGGGGGGSTFIAVSGTQNGTNPTFALSPAAVGTVMVFLNGQLLTSGIDYILTTSTQIDFQTGSIPVASDIIIIVGYAGAAPLSIRANLDLLTPPIAANAQSIGLISTIGKTLDVIRAESFTLAPVRVRLYSSAAARNADLTRDRYTPPTAGAQHQVIMDLVLTGTTGYTWVMSPIARGSNAAGINEIYYTLDNLDSTTRNLHLSLIYLTNES